MTNNVESTESEPWIDIGSGVGIRFFTLQRGGERVGLIERHRNSKGEPCEGFVRFDNYPDDSKPRWKREGVEPLTLSPSILCKRCGHHGFIRGGHWEPS